MVCSSVLLWFRKLFFRQNPPSTAADPKASRKVVKHIGLRSTSAEDLPWLQDLHEACFRPSVENRNRPWNRQDQRAGFASAFKDKKSPFRAETSRLIQADGVDVGQLVVTDKDDGNGGVDVFLERFMVHPTWQRHGIGEWAVRQVMKEAEMRNVAVRLIVQETNTAARGLYERMGFQVEKQDFQKIHMVKQFAEQHETTGVL